jgi:hypothetical protein
MARKITLCGKELNLACTMHAAVSYEKMTGKSALDLGQFQDNKITPIVEMGFCMLLAQNDSNDIPTLENIMNDLDSVDKMAEFLKAVSEEIVEFYRPEKSPKEEKSEDVAKNG